MPGTLGEMLLAASARYGDDVALQIQRGFRWERTTYARAAHIARGVAAWCVRKGLRPGDRIAVWAPNMPEYALLYFGAWLAGFVVVPIDARTRPEVVERTTAASGARVGFRSAAVPGTFGASVETYLLEDLIELTRAEEPAGMTPAIAPDALAVIVYTSGTTGTPKGVMLTHANLVAETEALGQAYPLKRGLVALSVLPLSHVYELTVTFLHGFRSGIRVTFVRRVNAATIARAMAEERVEAMVVVPELLRLMLRGIERRVRREGGWSRWSTGHRIAPFLPFALRRLLFAPVLRAIGGSLDFVGVGGAPLDLPVARAWERMGVHVFEGYGLTETSGGVTINARGRQRLGSAGRRMPGVMLRFAEDGEILLTGPTVTPGYFGDEVLTTRAFADGWLRSGDVGRLDADGYLYVTGRSAFRIVLPDGRKVYPEDVERELNAEPSVRDSCVVGVKDELGHERVHAALLIDEGRPPDAIVRSANARLAPHQRIRTWSTWPDEDFPRGPTLKPDRAIVRAAVEREPTAPARPSVPAATEDPLVDAIAQVSGHPPADVRNDAELEIDLGLDSIGRIELLSLLEEEMGVAIDELRVDPRSTVGLLRQLIREAEVQVPVAPGARWPRSSWARLIGDLLLWATFKIQDHWLRLEVVHPERAPRIPVPSLIVFNYQAPYAAVAVLRTIPRPLRHRIAIAADADAWSGLRRWQGWLAALGAQAFPMMKGGGPVRSSIEEAARWLADGYAVMLSPEGAPSMREEAGPFLRGVGLLAVETGLPIVPFLLEGYSSLYPRHDVPFPWLPEHNGTARVTVGEPVGIPPGATPAEATELTRRAIFGLRMRDERRAAEGPGEGSDRPIAQGIRP